MGVGAELLPLFVPPPSVFDHMFVVSVPGKACPGPKIMRTALPAWAPVLAEVPVLPTTTVHELPGVTAMLLFQPRPFIFVYSLCP